MNWDKVSKHIFMEVKKDNNMVMLQNLSHLEPYVSDVLHDKLFKSTLMRMENEIKMLFF